LTSTARAGEAPDFVQAAVCQHFSLTRVFALVSPLRQRAGGEFMAKSAEFVNRGFTKKAPQRVQTGANAAQFEKFAQIFTNFSILKFRASPG
jgi:hypothetical protein